MSQSIAVQLTPTGVRDGAEIKSAIEAFAREPNGALIVLPNPVTLVHRELTIGSSIILRGSSPKSLAVPTCVRWRWRRALAPLEREGWRVLSCDDEGMAAQIITVEFDQVEGIEENTIIVVPVNDAVTRRPERRVLSSPSGSTLDTTHAKVSRRGGRAIMVREVLFGMLVVASTMSQAGEPAKLVLACQGHTHYLGADPQSLPVS